MLAALAACSRSEPTPRTELNAAEGPPRAVSTETGDTSAAGDGAPSPTLDRRQARERCEAQIPADASPWLVEVARAFCREASSTPRGGSSMAVSDERGTRLTLQVGQTCLHDSPPVTRDTVFRWGSISKIITTLSVLTWLEASGQGSTSTTIGQWIPQLRGHWSAEITLAELLSHTSGLTTLPPLHTYASLEALLADIRTLPAPAGQLPTYAYGNVNYVLAAKIVEQLSGKGWDQAVREAVSRPLALRSMWTDVDREAGPSRRLPPSTACSWRGEDPSSQAHAIGSDYASRLGPRPWLRPAGAIVGDAVSLSTLGTLFLTTESSSPLASAAASMTALATAASSDGVAQVLGHPVWPGMGIYLLGVTPREDASTCAPRFHRGEAGSFLAQLWIFPACETAPSRGYSLAILDNARRPFGATLAAALRQPPPR